MKKTKLFRLIVPAPSQWNIYGHITGQTTSLGAIIVATFASKVPDWEVEVIDESNCKHRTWPPNAADGYIDHELLQRERPADVVGFYASLSCTINRVYELAKLYKSQGCTTIAGGYHVRSEFAEALNNGIDFVCATKGEQCIQYLLRELTGTKKDLSPQAELKAFKKQLEGMMLWSSQDLTLLFMNEQGEIVEKKTDPASDYPGMHDEQDWSLYYGWDFGLLRYGKVKICPVMMRGGCPYNCEFCAVKERPGKFVAEHFVCQIVNLYEKFRFKKFFIIDDHFGGDLNDPDDYAEIMKCLQLLTAYQKKIGKRFSFTCQIRLNACVDSRRANAENKTLESIAWSKYYRSDLLMAMRLAGIDNVCIGYESPIDADLKAMHKGYLSKDMLNWTAIWKKFGFKIQGMFIFNYPKHRQAIEISGCRCDVNEVAKTYRRFIRQGRIDTVQVLLPIPLPGTEFRKWLDVEKRIFSQEDFSWEYYDGQFMLYDPLDCEPEEMQEAVKKIMSGFYHFSHVLRLAVYCLWHFPVIVFPSTAALLAGRVKDIRESFTYWRREYWRNASIRFGGSWIVRGFAKKYKQANIPEKLKAAKAALARRHDTKD